MNHLPLISHTRADAIVARHRGEPIHASRFIADVRAVAAALPPGVHVLNACSDRYAFAVTLAAAMLDHRITLLPSTYTPEAVERLKDFAPDTFCVADGDNDGIPLRTVRYPIALPWEAAGTSGMAGTTGVAGSGPEPKAASPSGSESETRSVSDAGTDFDVPQIHVDRVVAYVFTSGSTGVPVPHAKRWGHLVHCVLVAKAALELDTSRTHTLIGTVPPQHMFGFESTILLALLGGEAFDTGRPFYPADIVEAIASAPEPRVLVTTPVHLRSLLIGIDAQTTLPHLDLVLSATAPLSTDLATQAEQRFTGPLKEIYGSTETGQIATRRTAVDDSWLLMPGIRLEWQNGQAWASEGHIETATPLGDLLEPRGVPDATGHVQRFALTGRTADMVNIAGKRTSIGYLNHQIASIAGVVDAGFYMPDDEQPGIVTRLAAFAVAPGLSASSLMAALRERIEPAFLPRPLVLVDALPRNDTGKLVRATLKSLYDQHVRAHRPPAAAAGAVVHAAAHDGSDDPGSGTDIPALASGTVASAQGAGTQPTGSSSESERAADAEAGARIVLPIDASHPAYAGHFPGRPVLPGVVLLDAALSAIGDATGVPLSARELASAKFLSPVVPGETLTLEQRTTASGAIEFTIRAADRVVARGTVAS
ncbi:Beta-hydroxyacyl-ACP dehydratase [Pararobbsia alpina]|uniref:AMP-binding protein n=1 Tax=Pararobbsia alpina TaxID=621374 RepID=UPI0039A46696